MGGFIFFFSFSREPPPTLFSPVDPTGVSRYSKGSWGMGKLSQKQPLLAGAPVGSPSSARPDALPAGSILQERGRAQSGRCAPAGAAPLPPESRPDRLRHGLKIFSFSGAEKLQFLSLKVCILVRKTVTAAAPDSAPCAAGESPRHQM